MDVDLAARIVALRPPLEALMIRATKDPEGINKPGPQEEILMAVLRILSRPSIGRHKLPVEGYGGRGYGYKDRVMGERTSRGVWVQRQGYG